MAGKIMKAILVWLAMMLGTTGAEAVVSSELSALVKQLKPFAASLDTQRVGIKELAEGYRTPESAVRFINENIRHLSYNGRLRGAEGTLAALEGNEIDRCELLVSLLRAQSHDARFAVQAVGKKQHVWAQLKVEEKWRDLFLSGQTVPVAGKAVRTYDALPKNMNCIVRLQLQLRVDEGNGKRNYQSLNVTLPVPALFMREVTLNNRFRGREENGRFMIEAVQPVLQVGEQEILGKPVPSRNDGKSLQPAGRLSGIFDNLGGESAKPSNEARSEFIDVIAEWVDVTVTIPGAPGRRLRISLFNRGEADGKERRPVDDLLTAVAFEFSSLALTDSLHGELVKKSVPEMEMLVRTLEMVSSGEKNKEQLSDEELAQSNRALEQGQRRMAAAILNMYMNASAGALEQLTRESPDVRAVLRQPRVIVAKVAPQEEHLLCSIDLARNPVEFIDNNGDRHPDFRTFQYYRGLFESRLEGEVLRSVTGSAGITAGEILNAALDQGIPLWVITQETRNDLRNCRVGGQSRTLLFKSLREGRAVFIPESAPLVNGRHQLGWFELDPETGYLGGVLADGSHGAMSEYIIEDIVMKQTISQGMSYLSSMVVSYYVSLSMGLGHFYACLLDLDNPEKQCFGSAEVCNAALKDTLVFCKIWTKLQDLKSMGETGVGGAQNLAGGKVLDLIKGSVEGLIPWPKMWETLAGDPCERGAKYGLRFFGCGAVF